MLILGIDPGRYGAIALYAESGESKNWAYAQLPITEVKKGRFDISLHELYTLLYENDFSTGWSWAGSISGYTDIPDLVVIEDPPLIPTNGSLAIRSLFKNLGEIRGLMTGYSQRNEMVNPKVWKSIILPGTAKDKLAAINYCTNALKLQIPAHPKYPRQLHDGVADAFCLAEYGRRLLGTLNV